MTDRERSKDLQHLSRAISHALRHAPERYGLEPDPEGWVPVSDLLQALRVRRREWRELTETDLSEMMARADKQRFEIQDGRIRALYGHSIPARIARVAARPPPVLYHGTSAHTVPAIMQEGLKPMGRQLVHLSTDVPTALQVARRKGPHPVVLLVDARAAEGAGIPFYEGNPETWLADAVPARFVSELKL